MARGSETKAALLEAAKRLVVEQGYERTTVRQLAAASGTNPAAVNYHFGSRDNLLKQAVLEYFIALTDRVVEAGPGDPNAGALEQAATRARTIIDGISEIQPGFVIFLEWLVQARRSPELKGRLAAHYTELRRRLGESMRATTRGRELPDRTIEVVASYMIAVADGLQLQLLFDPKAVPTGDELAALYEGISAYERARGQREQALAQGSGL